MKVWLISTLWGILRYDKFSFKNRLCVIGKVYKYLFCFVFKVIIGDKLKNINIGAPQVQWNNRPLFGLMFIRVLPPKDLKHPFLLHRTTDKRAVASLCQKCAEKQILSTCTHNGNQKT